MEGFVVVAKRPDSSTGVYGVDEGIPFGTRGAAEAVAENPAEHLEADWECTVLPVQGLPE